MSKGKRTTQAQDYPSCDLLLSLRRVNTAYDGIWVTVRRGSADAETTNIFMNKTMGFIDDNSLCDGSLSSPGSQTIATWKTHTGASTLYVRKWWDVSGKGNYFDQVNPAFQPSFFLNGAGNKARIGSDGVNDFLNIFSNRDMTIGDTIMFVYERVFAADDGDGLFYSNTLVANSYALSYSASELLTFSARDSTNTERVNNIESVSNTNLNLVSVIMDNANTVKAYLNGTEKFNVDFNATYGTNFFNPYLGSEIASNRNIAFFGGYIDEVIHFNKPLTDSERQPIENNCINFHGITL